ncbi:MAG: hypothetical protein ACYSTT_11200 [Planctomycetota bacterium]
MTKMEEMFQVPGSTDSNTETETTTAEERPEQEQDKELECQIPATEEKATADLNKDTENIKDLEQDEDVKYQTPAVEEKGTADLEKDTEDLKVKASSGQNDSNSAQQAATESSEQPSKECKTNFDEEAECQPSFKQETVIEISKYVERTVRKETGYIGRHWRGELSLATSFWINLFLIDIFLKSVEMLTAAFIHNFSTSAHVSIIHNPFIIMILYPWQIIGLWRSCDRHIEATGKRFWARTAQVLVVLGFIATFSKLVLSWPLYNL